MIHPRPANRPASVTITLPLAIWLDILRAFKAGSDDAARISEISTALQAADRAAKIRRGAK